MFSRVAFIAPPTAEMKKIRELLSDVKRFELREFQSMAEVNIGLERYPFDVLMVRYPGFIDSTIKSIGKMRERFPKTPLLALTPSIDSRLRYQVGTLASVRVVEDLELSDLPALIEALRFPKSESKGAQGRMHPRAERKSHVELVNGTTGERIVGEFLDFAQMGARILLSTRQRLGLRTKWQVHYPSTSEPGKTQRLESIIVWEEYEKPAGLQALLHWPRTIVGLRFIASL